MQELGEVLSVPTDVLIEMIRNMRKAREEYEAIKEKAEAAHEAFKALEDKVSNALQVSGLDNFNVPGLGTAYLMRKYAVRVPKDVNAKRELFDYIRKAYGQDVLDEYRTVNYQTLNAFYKQECEHLGEGVKIPGLEEPTLEMALGFRKK